jgi:hypothetical protein
VRSLAGIANQMFDLEVSHFEALEQVKEHGQERVWLVIVVPIRRIQLDVDIDHLKLLELLALSLEEVE